MSRRRSHVSPARRRALVGAVAAGLLLAFVVVPLGATLVWQSVQTHRAQQHLSALLQAPSAPRPALPVQAAAQLRPAVPVAGQAAEGQPIATMRIPRFGPSWQWVVVEGTALPDLDLGPGHYRGTPTFGEVGNVGVAGHRAGHGSPFIDFETLRPGDAIWVTQRQVTWHYVVQTVPRIIAVTDVQVLDPLPGHRLTLTTCWPRYGSAKRMFVTARLSGWSG